MKRYGLGIPFLILLFNLKTTPQWSFFPKEEWESSNVHVWQHREMLSTRLPRVPSTCQESGHILVHSQGLMTKGTWPRWGQGCLAAWVSNGTPVVVQGQRVLHKGQRWVPRDLESLEFLSPSPRARRHIGTTGLPWAEWPLESIQSAIRSRGRQVEPLG